MLGLLVAAVNAIVMGAKKAKQKAAQKNYSEKANSRGG